MVNLSMKDVSVKDVIWAIENSQNWFSFIMQPIWIKRAK